MPFAHIRVDASSELRLPWRRSHGLSFDGAGVAANGAVDVGAVWIAGIDVVESIEGIHPELFRNSLIELYILDQRQIDASRYFDLSDAVQACQHVHTAIYPFRTDSSVGAPALAELSEKTGSRVFYNLPDPPTSKSDSFDELRQIEATQRNQYQLTYVPAELRHDGRFDRVQLSANDLQDHIEVRSGY